MPKCSDRAKELRVNIHDILINHWDPIGIADIPEAHDEYDAYIPEIYKMLISGKPKHEIFDYLWWLETNHMSLKGNKKRTEKYTDLIYNLIQNSE